MIEFEHDVKTALISAEEINRLKQENETIFIGSRFNFIKDHYGLRPGMRHLLIGCTGTGKSTLARSILCDSAKICKTLLYSSEESLEQTQYLLSLRDLDDDAKKNILILNEDTSIRRFAYNQESMLLWLSQHLVHFQAKLLIFDNLTTSAYYDGREYEAQIYFFERLSAIERRFHIPIILISDIINKHPEYVTLLMQQKEFSVNIKKRFEAYL